MANPNPKPFRVTLGPHFVTVSPWTNARGTYWRFRRKEGSGKHTTRKRRIDAKRAALDHLHQIAQGDSLLSQIDRDHRLILAEVLRTLPTVQDLHEFQKWREQKARTIALSPLVEQYLAHKILQKGQESRHLKDVRHHLEGLRDFLGPDRPVADITTAHLSEWIASHGAHLSASRYNNTRAAATALWNWSFKQGLIPGELRDTAARLPSQFIPPRSSIRYATPSEALFILHHVRPEFRLALVLGLFAGLRPEEAAADPHRKESLDRSAIDRARATIFIPRSISKGKRPPRTVPISECLESWLDWSGHRQNETGPVAPTSMGQARETRRLGKLLDEAFNRSEGWPHDWLRHTYGTHRNALVRHLAQVAEEMGTSVSMMERHYHQPIPQEDGEAFFALRPSDLHHHSITTQKPDCGTSRKRKA